MSTPFSQLGDADFGVAVQSLLPRGRAWPRRATALRTAFTAAIGDALNLLHQSSVLLLETESFPATAVQMLTDFEADYGLPDPCSPPGPTLAQRRAALLSKIAATGGQSAAYFVGIAAVLGYSVTITTFQASVFGTFVFGDPVCDARWRFAWQVNAPGAGGDLACRLGQIGPAYGVLWING